MDKYIAGGQISIFDIKISKHTKKVRLLKDCIKVHSKLKQDSVHEIFMEKDKHYIIRIDGVFCGIYKEDTELLEN